MGLLNKIFGSSTETTEEKQLSWISLTELQQLEEIKTKSETKTQFIFKHSTRCGISRMVKNQFEKDFDFDENQADLYYLDLIAYRDISNAIAETFQVVHESPQLLVVKNGTVVAHASHGAVNDLDLQRFA
ncbi:bacillithiol system redox-active protein YtxJ [Flavobacteriaceae bacterium SZ-1-7]|uniref:bacillithiol system redox-active protein YtxJ n=1 Tax=Tamlana sedimenti TaxID=3134126 RepID=UPI003120F13C